MKFTDGQWLLRPGVTAHYAAEARSITSEDGRLVIEAPVRAIRDRGDTLQGPLLTVTLSSPMRDVIRVRIEHFAGGLSRGPQIPIFPRGNVSPEIRESADFAIIKSGELAARIKKKKWALTFEAGGRVLTTSGWRAIAYMQTANWGNHVVEQLSLGVGENVYGLGERFTAFVKNGHRRPSSGRRPVRDYHPAFIRSEAGRVRNLARTCRDACAKRLWVCARSVAAQFTRVSGEASTERRKPEQFVAVALGKAFFQRTKDRWAA